MNVCKNPLFSLPTLTHLPWVKILCADHEMMRLYHVGELPLEQQGGTCGDSAAVSSFAGSGFLLLVMSSVLSLALVVM